MNLENLKFIYLLLYYYEIILYFSIFLYNVALDIPSALAVNSLSFYNLCTYLKLLLSQSSPVHQVELSYRF